jgi:hypothetical protein
MRKRVLITLAVVMVISVASVLVMMPSPSLHVGMNLGDPVAYMKAHGGGQKRRFTSTHWFSSGDSLEWDTDIFLRSGRVIATRYVTCRLATDGTVLSIESSWLWRGRF